MSFTLVPRRKNPLYAVWLGMKFRCSNPKATNFKWYGGRGITVCQKWLNSFGDFISDMGPRPTPKHMIERINNDGNYEPSNCRWATKTEQSRNIRSNRRINLNGESLTLVELSEQTGIKRQTLAWRLNRKLGMSEVLKT